MSVDTFRTIKFIYIFQDFLDAIAKATWKNKYSLENYIAINFLGELNQEWQTNQLTGVGAKDAYTSKKKFVYSDNTNPKYWQNTDNS